MNAFCCRGWFVFVFSLISLTAVRGQSPPATLTPPSPATPQIHCARVFGVHPGAPFLFTVAATGERPMTFSADKLPAGLNLDSSTGRITGTSPKAGSYPVVLHAKNPLGETKSDLLIKSGKTLALTPPLGWNSWNCFADAVSDQKVRAAVDAMVSSGLINHGWTYINIDDFWQVNPTSKDPSLQGAERDANGNILPNSRFPDMKALVDYIHSRGLKAGIYSSPGPYTCGRCTGSYRHEAQDARQYAAWGFDYLKYDWCTYSEIYKKESGGKTLDGLQKPYREMAADLKATGRDIVFSFCQYGMGKVWLWGAETGGNSWRTCDDIRDTWDSMIGNAEKSAPLAKFAGPGHWNDPDMLVVGKVGWGPTIHDTHLTPDEQYTHISLWCLQAAPLLIGCDLTQLDPFTLGLLTNDEVLAIDQDPLGKAAHLVPDNPKEKDSPIQLWVKPLRDGVAVGLINLGDGTAQCTVTSDEVGTTSKTTIYDVWQHKELGVFQREFESPPIPAHGVLLLHLVKTAK
jgi:alpha-galactosidase